MSINGVSQTTVGEAKGGSGDGTDDFGRAVGPQTLPSLTEFGFAFVFETATAKDLTCWMASFDGNSFFQVIDLKTDDGSVGEILIELRDQTKSSIRVETAAQLDDGDPHLIVVNVDSSSGAGGIDIYIDTMDSTAATAIRKNGSFDANSYANGTPMNFFARNDRGSADLFKDLDMSFIEFNEQPYSQQDRADLRQRAPGI
jgi:hypothetical protein